MTGNDVATACVYVLQYNTHHFTVELFHCHLSNTRIYFVLSHLKYMSHINIQGVPKVLQVSTF